MSKVLQPGWAQPAHPGAPDERRPEHSARPWRWPAGPARSCCCTRRSAPRRRRWPRWTPSPGRG